MKVGDIIYHKQDRKVNYQRLFKILAYDGMHADLSLIKTNLTFESVGETFNHVYLGSEWGIECKRGHPLTKIFK
jgi:hypothetical protein